MHADYKEAFNKINWQPDKLLWADSRLVSNRDYRAIITKKAQGMGINYVKKFRQELRETTLWHRTWPMVILAQEWPPRVQDGTTSLTLYGEITPQHLGFVDPELATIFSKVGSVLLHACVADPSLRPARPYKELDLGQMYREVSTNKSGEDRRRRIYRE
jgi:hypothetical protein